MEGRRRGNSKQSEVTRGSRVSSAAHHSLPKKHGSPKAAKHRKWRHRVEGGRKVEGEEGERKEGREGVTRHKVTDGKEFGNTCDKCIMHVVGSAE